MNQPQQKASLSGRFMDIRATNVLTGEVREFPDFDNLITNWGLDEIGTDYGWPFQRIHLGTGTTAPAPTDTALQTFGCYSSTTHPTNPLQSGIDEAGGYEFYRWQRRFAQGVATGTWSEIGMAATATPEIIQPLFSRALIKDGSGNPTTITVLPIEVLDVTYEARVYWPATDVTGTITIAGENYNYIMRRHTSGLQEGWAGYLFGYPGIPRSINGTFTAFSGTIGAGYGAPNGTAAGQGTPPSCVTDPYSYGSYSRVHRASCQPADCNLSGGMRTLVLPTSFGKIKIEFTPAIPKDNTKTFSLTRRVTWARRP